MSTNTSSILVNSNKSHYLIFFHPLESPTQKDSSLVPDCRVQLNTQTYCIILGQFPTACQEQEYCPSPNATTKKTTSNRRGRTREIRFNDQFSLNRTFITILPNILPPTQKRNNEWIEFSARWWSSIEHPNQPTCSWAFQPAFKEQQWDPSPDALEALNFRQNQW